MSFHIADIFQYDHCRSLWKATAKRESGWCLIKDIVFVMKVRFSRTQNLHHVKTNISILQRIWSAVEWSGNLIWRYLNFTREGWLIENVIKKWRRRNWTRLQKIFIISEIIKVSMSLELVLSPKPPWFLPGKLKSWRWDKAES
jgi:hypothetical protein